MRTVVVAGAVILLLVAILFVFNKQSIAPDRISSEAPVPSATDNGEGSPSAQVSTDMSNLKIEDIKEGSGQAVKSGDTVVINYKGTFTDGRVFDSSYQRNQPFETQIGVGRVIKGWDEGVVGMKVGGQRRLTIPPDLAYGPQGIPGAIPPNSTLIFDVELVAIK